MRGRVLACVAAAFLATLVVPSLASAADFTWNGEGAIGSAGWSHASNWEGTSAPSGSAESLTFPGLTNLACTAEPRTATCYTSHNDLSGLSADRLSLDSAYPYRISGNPFTLGSGGLDASASVAPSGGTFAEVDNRIELGASQSWTSGNAGYLALAGDIVGQSHAVTLGAGGTFELTGHDEVGPVDVQGIVGIGPSGGTPELNAVDQNPVSVTGYLATGGSVEIGPLETSAPASLQLGALGAGEQPSILKATGDVTFGAGSRFLPLVLHAGTHPGTDYSQLQVGGDVDLGGAELSVLAGTHVPSGPEPPSCSELTIGDGLTLISATGTVEGTFAGVPDGSTVSLMCHGAPPPAHPPTVRINYTTHTVTATVLTGATGTHTLNVSVAGGGSGSVSGSGIDCPGTCSHTYTSGSSVTLNAMPGPGSTFAGWSGGACAGTGQCTVTLSSDRQVTARFEASNGPIPPPSPTCRDASWSHGPFDIEASCFKSVGGKLVAKGRVRVNGVDLVPSGSGTVTIDPRALTLTCSGEVRVYLGSIEVYHHTLGWKLQGNLKLSLPPDVTIKGVAIKGDLQLAPSGSKGGLMQVIANAEVGPITGAMQLELTNAVGLQIQSASLSWQGGLPLKQLVVKSAALSYAHTSAGDEWTGKVSVELPAKLPTLGGKLAILNGKIAEVGLTASKINKPIGEIVYLQKIGLDVRVVPHITATGELGLSAGPTLPLVNAPAASLEGTLTADFGNPVVLSATGTVMVAGKINLASAKAKWTVPSRFELSGEAKISAGPASVDARVSGFVASGGFSLYGNGSVSIPGASGNGIVYLSEQGVGACFMESIGPLTVAEGFGTRWRLEFPSLWFDSCGLEDYKSKATASSSVLARSSSAGETIQVPAGQEQTLIGARGVSDFPAIEVQSPGGQLIDPANGLSGPVEGGGYRFVSDPIHHGTYVILARPKPGNWRIIAEPESPQIASYGSAKGAPPLGIKARVKHSGHGYTLSWSATQIKGEQIRFSEVSATTTRKLNVTSSANGSLSFRPAEPYAGGKRTIEALISVDGMPRMVATASFRVPRRALPKVRQLRISRHGSQAVIRWQPQRMATDLWINLSDGRRIFFALPPGSHAKRVRLYPWTKRATASIRPVTVTGESGPKAHASLSLG
jgi:hypothetical protein